MPARRRSLWAMVLGLTTLAWAAVAQGEALPPLTGYKHVSWSIEGGAPGRINALAQGRDGFLWIGSVEGLFRFDGVSFEPVATQDPQGGRVVVSALTAARSGEVWVGLARGQGVGVVRNGRLRDAHMPNPSREVNDLAEDAGGAIWVARGGRSRDTLARYQDGRWSEIGPEGGLPQQPVWQILFARDGAMWVVLSQGVFVRPAGEARFRDTGARVSPRASLGQDAQGRIWVSDSSGVRVLAGGAPGRPAPGPFRGIGNVGGVRILFDRRGDLWGATWNSGVFHVAAPGDPGAAGRVAGYSRADGLSSEQTRTLFEDREGNIWVGDELGLDMFRPASLRVEVAVPPNPPSSYRMAAARDGTVYVADAERIYAMVPGGPARVVLRTRSPAEALCASRDGGVWAPLADEILRVGAGQVRRVAKPPGVTAYGCAEDGAGRLWLPGLDKGLFALEDGRWSRWPRSGEDTGSPANVAVGPDGRAVVQFRTRPPEPADPRFVALSRDRMGIGGVEGLLPGREALFVSGARGLARIVGDQTRVLSAARYPWLASVNGLAQTPAGDIWMIGDAGVARLRASDLDAAFDQPGRPIPHRLFDFRDGLNSFAQKAPGAQAALGGDGRIWFLTRRNPVFVDPGALGLNTLPPPVTIRSAQVGERVYGDLSDLRLPARTTSLVIAYTATSLSVPSRVRFRYRLEGADPGWVEAGGRREALYANLRPGHYRFRVTAANDDGVWNRDGAALDFTIPPAFHQTWLFRISGAAVAGLLLWLVYALRHRQLSRRIRERLEERMGERERIARELHDTLLQGVQGLLMRFQSVADRLPDHDPTRAAMDQALDRAEQMLVEGRERLHDLRRAHQTDLDAALRELVAEQTFPPATRVSVLSAGAPRPVQPLVVDEALRIAGEALFNAARHARATEVVVRTDHGARSLDVIVQDDGVGIDPETLAQARPAGHYGLVGMRERARRMGARLTIASQVGAGVTIILSVPPGAAYAPAETPARDGAGRGGWRFWRRGVVRGPARG